MACENYISQVTKKRLVKDITDIYKNPLTEQGIYYIHDDTNMLRGYAMIIGPKDTPYENGIYFFEFNFPETYPQQPPKLVFLTNDGKTRFNPNLYTNGKVCLSILNTWKGEGWTSCQSIRTVLLTLITVLNEKPLLNEPGIKETHHDFKIYNDIITFKNIEYAVCDIGMKKIINEFSPFYIYIRKHLLNKKDEILEKTTTLHDKYGNVDRCLYCSIYSRMSYYLNYNSLYEKVKTLYYFLENNE